jgi:hypothetical protein
MIDLIAAIVDYYTNNAGAGALRNLIGTGKMVADFESDSDVSLPYMIVQELGTTKLSEGFDATFRVDNEKIQFNVFARSRVEVVQLLDALEDCFLGAELGLIDSCEVVGVVVAPGSYRQAFWELDNWSGFLQLLYTTQKI